MRPILVLFMILGIAQTGFAADYYVEETDARGLKQSEVESITPLIKSSIKSNSRNTVVDSQEEADYTVVPTLLKLGSTYILKLENQEDGSTTSSAQIKSKSLEELADDIDRLTVAVLSDRGQTQQAESKFEFRGQVNDATTDAAGTTETAQEELEPKMKSRSQWRFGFGPFFSRRLDSDNVMYHLTGGHVWEVHPQAEIKVIGEASFASADDSSRFFNFGAGASYFFPTETATSAPFITGDMGIGAAETDEGGDASGFSFGLGAGYQFFRNTDRSMNLLVRYAVITDTIEQTGGSPSILGAQLAFSF